jgi:hypothetical protein
MVMVSAEMAAVERTKEQTGMPHQYEFVLSKHGTLRFEASAFRVPDEI